MQQSNGKLSSTAYADHLRGCADLAKEIAGRMDIREDAARQACLATIIISADRHNLFIEPVPRDSKTPVIQPETAAAESEPTKKGVDRDEAAAVKADEQIKDVPRNPTPDQVESGNRTAFLDGIQGAVKLLNDEGHEPKIMPAGLNAYIKKEFPGKTQLGSLDVDELEELTKKLHSKLEGLRAKKKAAASNDALEDWP